jgi:uncharacterized protein YecT (DUF1311 family)
MDWRLKINAGYNALLAKQQGAWCSQRGEQSKLKDFEERWTKWQDTRVLQLEMRARH